MSPRGKTSAMVPSYRPPPAPSFPHPPAKPHARLWARLQAPADRAGPHRSTQRIRPGPEHVPPAGPGTRGPPCHSRVPQQRAGGACAGRGPRLTATHSPQPHAAATTGSKHKNKRPSHPPSSRTADSGDSPPAAPGPAPGPPPLHPKLAPRHPTAGQGPGEGQHLLSRIGGTGGPSIGAPSPSTGRMQAPSIGVLSPSIWGDVSPLFCGHEFWHRGDASPRFWGPKPRHRGDASPRSWGPESPGSGGCEPQALGSQAPAPGGDMSPPVRAP